MCRLYAQISTAPRDASDFLVDSERSLLKQGNERKKDYQADGWGIAHYSSKGPHVVKSAKSVFKDEKKFRAAAARARSKVVMGHLRAASNPMHLSRAELLGFNNTQPFTDGRFIFSHNGTVNIPLEVAKLLGPYKNSRIGLNDSEIYFWQFRKFYDLYGNIPDALEACVDELWTLWSYVRKKHKKSKEPYLGLNTLVSDGRSLHAMCLFPPDHPKRSLYNPKKAWGRMSFARKGDRVIFASEDIEDGWKPFETPEIISATIESGRISVKRRRFKAGA